MTPDSTNTSAEDERGQSAHLQRPDHGQATTEYALVLLGAAAVALLLVGWATGGGNRIGSLFDSVIRSIATSVR
jgi:Flp pilus assembly pilin Flp